MSAFIAVHNHPIPMYVYSVYEGNGRSPVKKLLPLPVGNGTYHIVKSIPPTTNI